MSHKFTLRDHQAATVEQGVKILTDHNLLYLSMEVRTGKTFTSLAIAQEIGFKAGLFVTKKKAISSVQSDYDIIKPSYNLVIVNFESLHKVAHQSFDFLILDEAHSIGAFPKASKRAKDLKQVAFNLPIIYLSGTPTPESYSQLFHQLWISKYSPWKYYSNFYNWAKDGFVEITRKRVGTFEVNDYTKANSELIKDQTDHLFISVSQEEAGFNAPVEERFLRIPLSPYQSQLIKELKKDKVASHKDITDLYAISKNGSDLITKIAQVCDGSLIYDDEDKGRVISLNKAIYIRENFKGKKIAILYRFKTSLEILTAIFPNHTTDPMEFNDSSDLVFLGQIQSVREGVNLSSADCMIMYSIEFSATSYFQARARIQDQKRTTPSLVYWLFSIGGIEQNIYDQVSNKKNFTYSYYKKIG